MKNIRILFALILMTLILCIAIPAHSLEYQWKYNVPSMDSREKAVQLFDLLHNVIEVYDVTFNLDSNSLMLFYDDEKTDEDAVKKVIQDAGFPVTRMMLLKEPKEGMMN